MSFPWEQRFDDWTRTGFCSCFIYIYQNCIKQLCMIDFWMICCMNQICIGKVLLFSYEIIKTTIRGEMSWLIAFYWTHLRYWVTFWIDWICSRILNIYGETYLCICTTFLLLFSIFLDSLCSSPFNGSLKWYCKMILKII